MIYLLILRRNEEREFTQIAHNSGLDLIVSEEKERLFRGVRNQFETALL